MKTLQRLLTHPITNECSMTTLYEYPAKVGTTGSTIIWLLEKPIVHQHVYGVCLEDHYSPYMKGSAFRYAPVNKYYVTDIQYRETGEFLILSK